MSSEYPFRQIVELASPGREVRLPFERPMPVDAAPDGKSGSRGRPGDAGGAGESDRTGEAIVFEHCADELFRHRARRQSALENLDRSVKTSLAKRASYCSDTRRTGIAGRQFQAAGCTVLGVEPDARMDDFARAPAC